MEYSLVPKSLNPSAAACAVTVYCKQPLEAIFWCAQEAFPDGLVQSESKQIRFTQNGTYFIQMVTQSQIYHAKIKISTIKAFRGFDGGDGSAQHPYILSNFVQFCAIVKDVRAHYRLVADLDFAEMLGDLS